MKKEHGFGASLAIAAAVIGLGCGGTLDTGTSKRPIKNKPAADGSCPDGRSLCGTGAFALCVDRQNDPAHCGACDRACTAGIACDAGVCQQTVCTGAIPFTGQPTTTPANYATINSPRQIFADVDGDGRLDLVEWTAYDTAPDANQFHVSLGQPGGGFATPDTYQASFAVQDIVPAYFNDDKPDNLFVFAATPPYYMPYHVEVWLGNTDGHLTRASVTELAGSPFIAGSGVAVGDLSGDGWPDMVMATSASSHGIDVLLSDSTGALHPSRTYPTGGNYAVFIRDWNGDGSPDLVVFTGAGLELLYNRGDGTFDPSVSCGVAIGVVGSTPLLVEDFNRDGKMDVALGGNPVNVILGLGACGFAPISYYDVPITGGAPILRAADMNGDGWLDIVVIADEFQPDPNPMNLGAGTAGDYLLTVLLGAGDGTFQLQDTLTSLGTSTITDVAIGQSTGDQRPDVIVSSHDGRTVTWENTCQ